MRVALTILVICFTQIAFSQGYRGSRFSFTYQPAYSFIDYLSLEPLVPIAHHKVSLGCALGKRFTVNVSAQHSTGSSEDYFRYDGDLFIKDQAIGIQFNYFRIMKQAFAPVGRYIGLGLEFGKQNSWRTDIYGGSDNDILVEQLDDTNREVMAMASLYFGRNFLIKERIMIGYGIQGGLVVYNRNEQPLRHFGKPTFKIGFIF